MTSPMNPVAAGTRLHLKVRDEASVDEAALRDAGALGPDTPRRPDDAPALTDLLGHNSRVNRTFDSSTART